jgi:hypothetical protein
MAGAGVNTWVFGSDRGGLGLCLRPVYSSTYPARWVSPIADLNMTMDLPPEFSAGPASVIVTTDFSELSLVVRRGKSPNR